MQWSQEIQGKGRSIPSQRLKEVAITPPSDVCIKVKGHRQYTKDKVIKCKFCGNMYKMLREECPAYGKLCNECQRMNHFASWCNNKRYIKSVQERDTSSDVSETESVDVIEIINTTSHKKNGMYAEMLIEGTPVKFQIDCGATVNIIPKKYVQSPLQPGRIRVKDVQPIFCMGNRKHYGEAT